MFIDPLGQQNGPATAEVNQQCIRKHHCRLSSLFNLQFVLVTTKSLLVTNESLMMIWLKELLITKLRNKSRLMDLTVRDSIIDNILLFSKDLRK